MKILIHKLHDSKNPLAGSRATINLYGKGGYLVKSVDFSGRIVTGNLIGPYERRIDVNPEVVKTHAAIFSGVLEYEVVN